MDCACIYVDDYDGPELLEEDIRKARKQHKCYECGRVIKIGEEYERTRGLWEGDWSTYKTCQDCKSLRTAFFCNGYIYGQVTDDTSTHINECAGEISSEILDKLTPNARKRVIEQIDQVWEDEGLWEEDE